MNCSARHFSLWQSSFGQIPNPPLTEAAGRSRLDRWISFVYIYQGVNDSVSVFHSNSHYFCKKNGCFKCFISSCVTLLPVTQLLVLWVLTSLLDICRKAEHACAVEPTQREIAELVRLSPARRLLRQPRGAARPPLDKTWTKLAVFLQRISWQHILQNVSIAPQRSTDFTSIL